MRTKPNFHFLKVQRCRAESRGLSSAVARQRGPVLCLPGLALRGTEGHGVPLHPVTILREMEWTHFCWLITSYQWPRDSMSWPVSQIPNSFGSYQYRYRSVSEGPVQHEDRQGEFTTGSGQAAAWRGR